MPRFFVPTKDINGDKVTILGDDARHIARSLRMAVGDRLTVCDMHKSEHICRLDSIRDDICELTILESREGLTESTVDITLYMAYPKGDKLDTVLQKAVELGVSTFIPFESSRCIKRPSKDRIEKQLLRLTRIANEASKQCGRGALTTVRQPIAFKDVLNEAENYDLAIFCYEGDDTKSLKAILKENKDVKSIAVVVGSEGGFSKEEAQAAKSIGFAMANLGPRILRCETAPAYALAAISYEYEL